MYTVYKSFDARRIVQRVLLHWDQVSLLFISIVDLFPLFGSAEISDNMFFLQIHHCICWPVSIYFSPKKKKKDYYYDACKLVRQSI